PCVDASTLALPERSTPPTVSTPGIVAGAPTRVVPLPRLPAATTMTTSCSNAYRKASSQLSGQSATLVVRDMLMTSAPWSTDQRIASATWSANGRGADVPDAIDTGGSSASGATPIRPVSGPVPRPAASDATQLPWSASTVPTGVRP